MLGSVAHQHIWNDILSASDVLLMPSKYEGISITAWAVAAGVIPVGKVGSRDEIVSADARGTHPAQRQRITKSMWVADRLLSGHIHLQQMSIQ